MLGVISEQGSEPTAQILEVPEPHFQLMFIRTEGVGPETTTAISLKPTAVRQEDQAGKQSFPLELCSVASLLRMEAEK